MFGKSFSDTPYVYITLLWETFSLGPDEARGNLPKACLSKQISPVIEKNTFTLIFVYAEDPNPIVVNYIKDLILLCGVSWNWITLCYN